MAPVLVQHIKGPELGGDLRNVCLDLGSVLGDHLFGKFVCLLRLEGYRGGGGVCGISTLCAVLHLCHSYAWGLV